MPGQVYEVFWQAFSCNAANSTATVGLDFGNHAPYALHLNSYGLNWPCIVSVALMRSTGARCGLFVVLVFVVGDGTSAQDGAARGRTPSHPQAARFPGTARDDTNGELIPDIVIPAEFAHDNFSNRILSIR